VAAAAAAAALVVYTYLIKLNHEAEYKSLENTSPQKSLYYRKIDMIIDSGSELVTGAIILYSTR